MIICPSNQWVGENLLREANEAAKQTVEESRQQQRLDVSEVRARVLQLWLEQAYPAGTA